MSASAPGHTGPALFLPDLETRHQPGPCATLVAQARARGYTRS